MTFFIILVPDYFDRMQLLKSSLWLNRIIPFIKLAAVTYAMVQEIEQLGYSEDSYSKMLSISVLGKSGSVATRMQLGNLISIPARPLGPVSVYRNLVAEIFLGSHKRWSIERSFLCCSVNPSLEFRRLRATTLMFITEWTYYG